jgi:hypothetical protein
VASGEAIGELHVFSGVDSQQMRAVRDIHRQDRQQAGDQSHHEDAARRC